MLKPVLRGVRRLLSVSRRARLIARGSPPERWFAAAVRWARLQWWICRRVPGRPDVLRRNAVFLDHLLAELHALRPFPVPFKIAGGDLLRADRGGAGMLLCTSHLPLFSLQLRAILQQGTTPLVIALQTAIGEDGCYLVTGSEERVPAVGPGKGALVKVRSRLASGGAVASMLDEYAGGPLQPQLLQLAGRLQARVVFLWSELAADGSALVWFAEAPYPVCDTEDKVRANLEAYDQTRQEILARAGQPPQRAAAVPKLAR